MYKKLQAFADRALNVFVPKAEAAACPAGPGCYKKCPWSECRNGCTVTTDCNVHCY